MKEVDLMKALGYEFDPGLANNCGFWFDPQEWVNVAPETWPSVYILENNLSQPIHAFELVTTQKFVRRILGMINTVEVSQSGPIIITGINSDDLIRAVLSGQVDMMRKHKQVQP